MWCPDEDARLVSLIGNSTSPVWDEIAGGMSERTARQCRERWFNYLNPAIRTAPWTEEEDNCLIAKVNERGHKWVAMTAFFNQRSESDIKNRWYSHLKFKCGQDPSGEWTRVSGSRQAHPTERKRRTRTKASPSQAARWMFGLTPNQLSEPLSIESPLEFCDGATVEEAFDESGGE
jgi:hypothetical protein